MARHNRNTRRGFTLIEVLVALSILGIAVLAMMKVMREGTVAHIDVRDRTFAEIVAENRLIETVLSPVQPDRGTSTGAVDMAGQRWTWTQRIAETSEKDIVRIDVAIRGSDSNREVAHLVGFRGRH